MATSKVAIAALSTQTDRRARTGNTLMDLKHLSESLAVRESSVTGSSFRQANLAASSFEEATLAKTRFSKVDLRDVSISRSDLSGLTIADCKMDGMTIDGVAVADLVAAYRSRAS